MSEENKAISRRADEELFNLGNLSVADELFAVDYVYHDPTSGEDWCGPEGVKQFVSMFRTAFPDLRYTIEDQIAEGDKVVIRYTASGTHQGLLMGLAPKGKRVEITDISIMRIESGKIKEIRENYDALGLMQQLGAVPSP
jgi:steroid delta-isomerase-like uncharacterized protein